MTLERALDELRAVLARHGRLGHDDVATTEIVDAALIAVRDALGPQPELLWHDAVDDARAHRADLAGLDPSLRLAVPPGTRLYDPAERQRAFVAQLESMGVPDVVLEMEREKLAGLGSEPFTPAWDQVFVLRDRLADWPGYRRLGALSIRTAARVFDGWRRAFPDDDGPARLLDDAAEALRTGAHARLGELRDELSARTYDIDGPAHSVLRAVIGAHDRVTQTRARDDQTEVEYHGEHAWQDAGGTFADWWMKEVRDVE